MKPNKPLNFVFAIAAVILGWTSVKKFSFETLKFENSGLAVIYTIVFVFSIYYLVKNYKARTVNK